MSLITKVKAGSITSLSDARYFAGMGVDWLGFDVNPHSDNYVSIELYQNIVGWVSGPKRVIEFTSHITNGELQKIVAAHLPDFIQVPIGEVANLYVDIPIMASAEFSTLDNSHLATVASRIQYLILDCSNPMENVEEISLIATYSKILLLVESDCANPKQITSVLPIQGFALKGSKEIKPGLKDYHYSNLLESLDEEG